MNTLSWLLYLGDVVGALDIAFGLAALLAGIAALALGVLGGMAYSDAIDDEDRATAKDIWRWMSRALVVMVVAGLLAGLIPSSMTLYMIAASEVGEHAINTPQASEAIKLLNDAIQRQLREAAGGSAQ